MRVLVLGATGMLGNAVLRLFLSSGKYKAVGTARLDSSVRLLPEEVRGAVVSGIDVQDNDRLTWLFAESRPQVVINCVGIVKQLSGAADPLVAIPINSLLPHRLASICRSVGARLVHISTDCVFAGTRGRYREDDPADADDLYGRSKHMGEVDYPNAVTLRTSIIGHELGSKQGLLAWFLAQEGSVRGFRRAVFSGLPSCELARAIRDHVLPHPELRGVYHVSAEPISKHDLLRLIAQAYEKPIKIEPCDHPAIDRSLDSTRFRDATGYVAPPWPQMIRAMREFG